MHNFKPIIIAALIVGGAAIPASAQQPAPSPPPITPYGLPIGLDAAKIVMSAAEAEAVKNSWPMAIVILDSSGHLVMLHKLDNTQYGSIPVAELKTPLIFIPHRKYRRTPGLRRAWRRTSRSTGAAAYRAWSDEGVEHAALPEQRMRTAFGGIRFQKTIVAKGFPGGTEQGQQRDGQRVQQP
jgi:hypothetical protein